MADIVLSINFRAISCCHKGCGITFCVPIWWEQKRREDHEWWYCPNGHHQHYPVGSSEAEKQRQRAERAEQRVAEEADRASRHYQERLHQERRASTFKGHCTRIRKKVVLGKCPCGCDGVFANLRRHMAKHHPTWQPDAEPMTPEVVKA